MDIGKQKEIQVEGSWIPQTPVRPSRPKPPVIYTDQQGNQLVQSNWLGPVGFSPGYTDGTHVDRVGACFASTSGIAFDGVHTFTNNLTRWKDISFTALLANANAAAVPASFPPYTNGGYSLGSQHIINGNYMEEPQYGKFTHEAAYGLNFHLGIMEDAVSDQMASHFAPVTPDKTITAKHEQVMEIQSLCNDERKNKERNGQNQITTMGVDNNQLYANNELQKLEPDSSLAGVSEQLMESQISDKVGGHAIDLNKTLQQKPRRKKHRPKVITEAKPRIQKLVTPTPPSNETPTVKRKYVQRNAINKPSSSLREKRKYVKKKPPNRASTTPAEACGKSIAVEMPEPAKTCRRALNFNTEKQTGGERTICMSTSDLDSKPEQDDVGGNQSKLTVHLSRGIEVIVENTQSGIESYDLNCCVSKMLESYTLQPAKQATTTISAKTIPPEEKQSTNFIDLTEGEDQVTAYNRVENSGEILLQTNRQMLNSPNSSNCSTCTTPAEDRQVQKSKRRHSSPMKCPDTCSTNLIGMDHNALSAYHTCWVFPSFSKKKRTEKVQFSNTSSTESVVTTPKNLIPERAWPQTDSGADPSMSRSTHWLSAAQSDSSGLRVALREAGKDFQLKPQAFGCIPNQTQRSTKKRSKVPTRARDLASVTSIARCLIKNPDETLGGKGQKVGNSNGPHACMEIPIAQMHATLTTKKRTKKRVSLLNLVSNTNREPLHRKPILYKQNQFLAELPGDPCKEMSSIEVIAEQLKHLDLNGEDSDHAYQEQTAIVPYSFENEKQNAVVPYERDGTIVPFPIKKRRPRPKVDLDEETNRVWKLLMANINSEGIDGADEEKTKWWEEERNVFCGRANSFIAQMHQVQGDRRFSQWKGSVVDSVIGVFLTQNVSDHLSSSAFMSLAACFPLKPNCEWISSRGERTRPMIDKPIVCILEPNETIKWDEEISNQLICDQSSITLHDIELGEERDVVNSSKSYGNRTGIISSGTVVEMYHGSMVVGSATETNEKCYVEEEAVINDAFSSQNSVISSQNSVDSPTQTAERKESFSESNLEAEYLNSASKLGRSLASTSFVELLQKADPNMLHEVYIQENYNTSSDQNSKDRCQNSQNLENVNLRAQMDGLDGLNLISHLEVQEVKCFEMTADESIYSNIIDSKGYQASKDHCSVAVECGNHIAHQNELTMRVQGASSSPIADNASCSNIQKDKHMAAESQIKCVGKVLNESRETLDVMESTSALDMHKKNPQNLSESDSTENTFSKTKELSEMIADKNAKSRRVGNEIKDNIDWDSLRKQAEPNGRKRERTANTMDSLDWEAVRCADVNEIADTIKERGMNNLLAERIKDFLNRLVTEHGNVDLEWLRDVPPDKAKEYLLSIRGLGLKSVECVRLLTLHQLAFPVDTNVGRIAVRLGWVPLQPLPESLQLHLLELYPVLESIQKYLWPRLCKLDQKTLYELHYQMITFGKVFCTKSKPNCNACPLRGECRHFASAFASARLALPGPEEKGLVSLAEGRTNDQTPAVMVNQVPLLLPQATQPPDKNQQWEDNQIAEARCSEPIIEEPSSPEPNCRQLAEIDIEDTFCEDPDEIPTIKLNMDEFAQNLQNYMQENMVLQESEMSKALVALTAHAASIPTPKLKNVSRLRTEHQVYELPDSHPLLEGLDKREPDDPCSYLLAIWTPGETADSIQPPERKCSAQEHGKLCDEETCFSCNSKRETNSQTVRGTLLIPCRTAMKGSFPLNGTYFQVNEVFADHDSSMNPIAVPRAWIWQLPRKTVYFGTSVPTIFKGMTTEAIQECFWKGFVCVRGFDQKTRAPRPLIARLHFPASKLAKTKAKDSDD